MYTLNQAGSILCIVLLEVEWDNRIVGMERMTQGQTTTKKHFAVLYV